jgi:hypothetical protein
MRDRWPRARVGFLTGGGFARLIGLVIAMGGVVDGEPAAITLGLGAVSLSLVGSFAVVDRVFHALRRRERALLIRAFIFSVVIYLVFLVMGSDASGDTLLIIAGIPGLVTGAVTMGVVVTRRDMPKDGA